MFMHLIFNQTKVEIWIFSTCCYFSFFNPSNLLSGKRSQTRKESPQSSCKCVDVMYRYLFLMAQGGARWQNACSPLEGPELKKRSFHENLNSKVAYELISNFLLSSSHLSYSFSSLTVTSEDDPSFPIKYRVFPLFLEEEVGMIQVLAAFPFHNVFVIGRSLWGIQEPVFW